MIVWSTEIDLQDDSTTNVLVTFLKSYLSGIVDS